MCVSDTIICYLYKNILYTTQRLSEQRSRKYFRLELAVWFFDYTSKYTGNVLFTTDSETFGLLKRSKETVRFNILLLAQVGFWLEILQPTQINQ